MNSTIVAQTDTPAQALCPTWIGNMGFDTDPIPTSAFEPVDLDCWDTVPATKTPDIWNDEPRKGCSFCGAYTDGGDWCARHAATEGPEIQHIEGMTFKCESSERVNVFYTVNLSNPNVPACSCPARGPCKHPGQVRPHVARLQPTAAPVSTPVAPAPRPKIAASVALDDCFATKAERRVA